MSAEQTFHQQKQKLEVRARKLKQDGLMAQFNLLENKKHLELRLLAH